MAGPRRPLEPPDDTAPGFDEESFVETPTAPSAPRPEDLATSSELPMIAEPLPEMSPEIWQAGIQALVAAEDQPEAASAFARPEEWADEARIYSAESELAETPAVAATLLMAGARAAEL